MGILLNELRCKLLYKFSSEHEEIASIRELFEIFNYRRDELRSYSLDEKLVSAYALFYTSTNFAKWSACMSRVPKDFWQDVISDDIVEIGTGPGTFPMAFVEWLRENELEFKHKWWGVDQSSIMLDQARKLLNDDRVKFLEVIPSKLGATIVFTHSLNEMSVNDANKIIGRLKPKRIIWIEPGTKIFFHKSVELRNSFISEGYKILTPCLEAGECPATLVQDEWCHQILNVRHESCVERLCQKIGRDRRVMPVSFHVYEKRARTSIKQSAVLFHKVKRTKHSLEWRVCLEQNGESKLVDFEVALRGLKKSQVKDLEMIDAGVKFQYEVLKVIDEKRWRVSIS